jgi:hypothetical protein
MAFALDGGGKDKDRPDDDFELAELNMGLMMDVGRNVEQRDVLSSVEG